MGFICDSPNLDVIGVKFDSRLTFEDHVHGIVSRVSQIIGIFRLLKRVFLDTSALLRCYYALVLPILEYCSPVWGSAAECHLQLLERQVYSWPGFGGLRCEGLLLNVIFSYSSANCIRGQALGVSGVGVCC